MRYALHRSGRGLSTTLKQYRYGSILRFLDKDHDAFLVHVDADRVAEFHLLSGNEVCQREHDVAFDGTLQVTCTILRVGAFLEQEIFDRLRGVDDELVCTCRHQNALLHHTEFDVQNLLQVFGTQGLEHDRLVDAVHELRRELAASGFQSTAVDLRIQRVVDHEGVPRNAEAHTAVDQLGHLCGTEVRCHDDDALAQVHAAVVAERERGFVENAEQELPE